VPFRDLLLGRLGAALNPSRRRSHPRPLGDRNQLHWVLDVVFNEDQSRLRKGHGAANMAVVRHFAINQVPTAQEAKRPPRPTARPRRVNPSAASRKTSIKLRRKIAGWDLEYLQDVLGAKVR
jgi:hypothetical protein